MQIKSKSITKKNTSKFAQKTTTNGVKQNQKIGVNHKINMHVNVHTAVGAHIQTKTHTQQKRPHTNLPTHLCSSTHKNCQRLQICRPIEMQ